jgi:hypothetical protein
MGDVCQQAFNLGFQTGTMKDSTTMIAALGMKHYQYVTPPDLNLNAILQEVHSDDLDTSAMNNLG